MLLIVTVFLYTLAFAQSDSIKRPKVGDHTFTPVSYSNLPFTNTYLYTTTGVGQSLDLVHQLDPLDGTKLIGLQGEVSFIDIGFSYQQRVRDWLAVYISLNLSARLGTELQSILLQGVNTVSGFEIGWHIRLLESDKVALSTVVELENLFPVLDRAKDFLRDSHWHIAAFDGVYP